MRQDAAAKVHQKAAEMAHWPHACGIPKKSTAPGFADEQVQTHARAGGAKTKPLPRQVSSRCCGMKAAAQRRPAQKLEDIFGRERSNLWPLQELLAKLLACSACPQPLGSDRVHSRGGSATSKATRTYASCAARSPTQEL